LKELIYNLTPLLLASLDSNICVLEHLVNQATDINEKLFIMSEYIYLDCFILGISMFLSIKLNTKQVFFFNNNDGRTPLDDVI